MKTIWKFQLVATDLQSVMMPEGATILTAQMQGETLCLWALVDPSAPTQRREIEVRGTGHEFPEDTRHYISISTVQMEGGALVFHVFERL